MSDTQQENEIVNAKKKSVWVIDCPKCQTEITADEDACPTNEIFHARCDACEYEFPVYCKDEPAGH